MNPLNRLRSLVNVASAGIESGTVVAVTEDTVVVRTAKGLRNVAPTGASTYKVGDPVRLQDNVLLGKGNNPDNLPVFRV